jgi:outer membrane lipoprotein-sorting protein
MGNRLSEGQKEKTMKKLLVAMLLVMFASSFALAEDAASILKKADDNLNNYKNLFLTSTITIRGDGPDKVREMRVWSAGEMRMIKFVQPATDRGIALLSTNASTNFVYLPAYKKVRRVASHVRNQTFMGTDFSQEDMAILRYGTDYTPKIAEETETHYVLDLTRKPGAKISYSRLQLKVGKEHYTVEQIVYYNNAGEKQKIEDRSDYLKLTSSGGDFFTMQTMMMTDVKSGHKTLLKNSDIKVDQDLAPDFFSQRNLKRPVR